MEGTSDIDVIAPLSSLCRLLSVAAIEVNTPTEEKGGGGGDRFNIGD